MPIFKKQPKRRSYALFEQDCDQIEALLEKIGAVKTDDSDYLTSNYELDLGNNNFITFVTDTATMWRQNETREEPVTDVWVNQESDPYTTVTGVWGLKEFLGLTNGKVKI